MITIMEAKLKGIQSHLVKPYSGAVLRGCGDVTLPTDGKS